MVLAREMRQGDLARWLGVSPQYLSQQRKLGVVVVARKEGRSVWLDVPQTLRNLGREVPDEIVTAASATTSPAPAWIELTGGRREQIAVPADSAVAVARALRPGVRITGTNKGQFSLLDLLRATVDVTGPADVVISTWSSGIRDIETAGWLLQTGAIRSMRWVVDRSFATRQPDYASALEARFGVGCISTTEVHAKVCLISAGDWRIAIRSSMNLNRNKRFEQFDLDDDPAVHSHYLALLTEIANLAGPGYGDKAAAVRVVDESMGGAVAAPDVYASTETDVKRDARDAARDGHAQALLPMGDDEVSYHSERALHERAKRELAELKLAAARAELLDADTVRRVYADVGAATREAVMALEVEAATELDEHGLTWLQGALRRALEQASADAERLSAALDGTDDDDDDDDSAHDVARGGA